MTLTLTGGEVEHYISMRLRIKKLEAMLKEVQATPIPESPATKPVEQHDMLATQRAIQDDIEKNTVDNNVHSVFPTVQSTPEELVVDKKEPAEVFVWTVANLKMLQNIVDTGYELGTTRTLKVIYGKLPSKSITFNNFKQSLARMGIKWKNNKGKFGTNGREGHKNTTYWKNKERFEEVLRKRIKQEAKNA